MAQTASADRRPRVPLAIALDSRFGAVNAQQGLGVHGNVDARVVNGFVEKDAEGDWHVYKRPGTSIFTAIDFPVGGMTPQGQYIAFSGVTENVLSFYFTAGNIIIYKNGSSGVTVGSAANQRTTASQYVDDKVAINTGQAFVRDYTVSAGSVLSQAVPTSSTLVPGIVTLDNTTYVMDQTATIWGSGLGNVVFGGNFTQAISVPGNGIFLTKQGNYVVAMKRFSTEFMYDAANITGNPISPARGMEIQIGCIDSRSVQEIDDVLVWLAGSRQSRPFIAMMRNYQIQRVSPPWIDRILEQAVFASVQQYSFSFKMSGHTFYGYTSASNTVGGLSITILFDLDQQQWYFWNDFNSFRWSYIYAVTINSGAVVVQNLVDSTTLYFVAQSLGTDLGVTVPMDIYTPNADFGTRKQKTLSRMDFIADQQPGFLQTRFSEDDQQTWSQFRSVDLNQKRPTLLDCGSFKRRSWNFRYTAPTPLRLSAVELDMRLGS